MLLESFSTKVVSIDEFFENYFKKGEIKSIEISILGTYAETKSGEKEGCNEYTCDQLMGQSKTKNILQQIKSCAY